LIKKNIIFHSPLSSRNQLVTICIFVLNARDKEESFDK